jgi:hypothetical protein
MAQYRRLTPARFHEPPFKRCVRFPRKRLNENSRAAELPHTLIEVVGGFRRAFVPASSPARPKRRPFPATRLAQTAATFTWCCGPPAFTRSQKFLTRGSAGTDFTMRLESGTGRSDAFTDRNCICWNNASFRTHHLSILTGWRLDVPKIGSEREFVKCPIWRGLERLCPAEGRRLARQSLFSEPQIQRWRPVLRGRTFHASSRSRKKPSHPIHSKWVGTPARLIA